MSETFRGEVIVSIPPAELGEYDLEPDLHEWAVTASRHVLVCRTGGHPSILRLIWAFIRRNPIEPVTILSAVAAEEGAEITATIEETTLAGVHTATDCEVVRGG